MIAVTRAVDTGTAAADALCKDRALQTRTRTAAEAAQKELIAAAQAEAEQDAEVGRAHIDAIQAGLAQNGSQQEADAKTEKYNTLKETKTKAIIDAAFATLSPPAKPPACAPQRQANTPPAPPPIPPLPATPQKSIAMLRSFSDPVFKATLAQPGLRGRVETLMSLEGCDWRVNANALSQATPRAAGTYLNRMNDEDLRDTLNDSVLLDRVDAFRNDCAVSPQGNTLSFPEPTNPDPGPNPYGYPGEYGTRGNRTAPSVTPYPYGYPYGSPYGYPYGGYIR
jgi:hypothetical protein